MPASEWEVAPPSNVTVEHEHKPVLYLADGKALVRTAGFTVGGQMSQPSGTFPQLNSGKKSGGKKKGPGGRSC